MAKRVPKVSNSRILAVAIYIAGIIIFGLVVLWNQRALSDSKKRNEELRARLEMQEVLAPLAADLKKKINIEEPPELALPRKRKLSRSEVGRFSDIFQDLARKNDLEFNNIIPYINTLDNNSGYLLLDLVVQGRFTDLRGLLIQLAQLPYLQHIERVDVQSEGGLLKMKVKMWLLME